MGKATITGGGTDGRYNISLEFNTAAVNKKLSQLSADLIRNDEALVTATAKVGEEQTKVDDKADEVNQAILDYQTCIETAPTGCPDEEDAVAAAQADYDDALAACEACRSAYPGAQGSCSDCGGTLPDIPAACQALKDAVCSAKDALAAAKAALQACQDEQPSPDNCRKWWIPTLTQLSKELATTSKDLQKAKTAESRLKLEKTSLTKEYEALLNVDSSVAVDNVWCCDLTETLNGSVGTVEVPGERKGLYIRPGYNGRADYSSTRDGQLTPSQSQTPEGTYWNWAVMPGWQKWKPQYRSGIIYAIDLATATCSVRLDRIGSSQQSLEVNYEPEVTGCAFEYMSCNESSFTVGDHVILEYRSRDYKEKPVVIGFCENPKPCKTAALYCWPAADEALYGWGDPFFTEAGTLINAPLGTPLASLDVSKLPFTGVNTDSATRRTRPKAGWQWWQGPTGIVTGKQPILSWLDSFTAGNGTLYYAGTELVLAIEATGAIGAAALVQSEGITYLRIFDNKYATAKVYQWPITISSSSIVIAGARHDVTVTRITNFPNASDVTWRAVFSPDGTKLCISVIGDRVFEADIPAGELGTITVTEKAASDNTEQYFWIDQTVASPSDATLNGYGCTIEEKRIIQGSYNAENQLSITELHISYDRATTIMYSECTADFTVPDCYGGVPEDFTTTFSVGNASSTRHGHYWFEITDGASTISQSSQISYFEYSKTSSSATPISTEPRALADCFVSIYDYLPANPCETPTVITIAKSQTFDLQTIFASAQDYLIIRSKCLLQNATDFIVSGDSNKISWLVYDPTDSYTLDTTINTTASFYTEGQIVEPLPTKVWDDADWLTIDYVNGGWKVDETNKNIMLGLFSEAVNNMRDYSNTSPHSIQRRHPDGTDVVSVRSPDAHSASTEIGIGLWSSMSKATLESLLSISGKTDTNVYPYPGTIDQVMILVGDGD